MSAPALVKNQKIWARTSGVTATARQAGAERRNQAGGDCATIAMTPDSRKSHRISDSVHAVTTAITAKMTHWSLSFEIVSLASL